MRMDKKIFWFLVLAGLLLAGHLYAQAPKDQALMTVLTPARGQVDLAVGYSADPNHLTDGTDILLQGGSAELTAHLLHGLAGVASVTGLHTGTSTSGVPQNLVVAVFGPRFTVAAATKPGHMERTSVFVQALVGEANGFDGVFPNKAGSSTSANGLALKAGGGLEIGLGAHFSVRAVQVDFLQTQLSNGTTNVQRSVLVGAGIVLHTAPKQ